MDARHALIVDDEADILELVRMTLEPMGIACHLAEDLGQAYRVLNRHPIDFCLTDMRLPDGDGLELVTHIQKRRQQVPIAVITAYGNVQSAVDALKGGAFDFVSKPIDINVLRNLARTALRVARPPARRHRAERPRLSGNSEPIQSVRALIAKLARSQAPILISGESGTGKELAARMIHDQGPRSDGPFVPVNCGAIPEHLMESELFGYRKGAFTGATQDRSGLFQAAAGGTLFLDEVGELPQHMQVKLLRAIQERAVRPIGGDAELPTDVRILSASHHDLGERIRRGEFRQDLYYRVNVIELHMPSLRERPSDIPGMAHELLERMAKTTGHPSPALGPDAIAALRGYAFPGNVRELENVLERAITLCEGEVIQPGDLGLPPARPAGKPPGPQAAPDLESYLEDLERDAIVQALEATGGNKTAAAERLGISFRALRYRLKKLGLD